MGATSGSVFGISLGNLIGIILGNRVYSFIFTIIGSIIMSSIGLKIGRKRKNAWISDRFIRVFYFMYSLENIITI